MGYFMKNFLQNEKRLFIEFINNSKILLSITGFFILLSYGIKMFYFDYSIDTEVIMNNYAEQMSDWLTVNRIGLVFTKFLLFHHRFNPYVANVLTFFTYAAVSVMLCYLVIRILNIQTKKLGVFILSILFITHPIIAEQFNFTLQNFEVALAILFLVLSFFFSYYYIITNYKTFALVSILLCVWSFLTYQSVYTFVIAGAVASFISILYRDQKENQVGNFKKYFIIIVKYALLFIASFVLSQLVAYVYNKIEGVPSSSYLTRQILWGQLSFHEIIHRIKEQIVTVVFARSFFYNYGFLFSAIIVFFIIVRHLFQKNKSVYYEIIGFVFLYLSPFILTILLGQGEAIRAQMPALEFVIAFNFYYIYLHINHKFLQKCFVILCIFIAFNQSYVTANLLFSEHVKYEEDVRMADRINFQLDSMGIGDRKNYSLIILGKHEPENVMNLQGETLGHSFFAWDIGTKQGTSIRAVNFMRTLGYLFNSPTDKQLDYALSVEKKMSVFPAKGSIRVVKHAVIVKLSEPVLK